MTRLVLLHSPLLGPLTWQPVAEALRLSGLSVETPAWPRLSTVEGDYYHDLSKGLAACLWDRDEPLILVAHSQAGSLIGALDNWLATVVGVIFVDAILQHPDRSWFDTAPATLGAQLRMGATLGELPTWDKWWPPGALERLVPDTAMRDALLADLEPIPSAYFEHAAPSDVFMGPAAYLQLSGAYSDEADQGVRYGWPVVRLPLHHLAMLTHAEAVAGAIESLAERLEAAP